MYAGRIVELGGVRDVIDNPLHPYTQGLLAAIPENHSDMRNLRSIPGSVPHPRDFVMGCRFADRCEKCAGLPAEIQAKCRSEESRRNAARRNSLRKWAQNILPIVIPWNIPKGAVKNSCTI